VAVGGVIHIAGNHGSNITFFDALGRTVLSKNVSDVVSLDGIPPGSYFYKLDGDAAKAGRIIITP
jgi:hypothetical protein